MMPSIALLATTTLAVVEAGGDRAASRWANVRRHLSFEEVVGYKPGSQVTDHCAIDRDQAAIEDQLTIKTPESWAKAQEIYNEGGNSKSYASVTLTNGGLRTGLTKGTTIFGRNADGVQVSAEAYDDYAAGSVDVDVLYTTSDIQASYVECQVGALAVPNLKGCLVGDGNVTIGDVDYPYTYTPEEDNNNGRTIAGFSTAAKAKMRLTSSCKGCPYDDFMYFYDYYGVDDYAHQWVEAAFKGEDTRFDNGNADFSLWKGSYFGREQAVKKGSAYMNLFMYVIREFEDALDDCEIDAIDNNEGSVHAWDEGVCFYAGSKEGTDPEVEAAGVLLHNLADRRCANFKTCALSGDGLEGTARVNHQLMDLFALGGVKLKKSDCASARDTLHRVVSIMYVPMIQGALRYAYKVGALGGGEKEKGEGATFAAAVLPRVHAASPSAATIIYDNLRVGAPSTDFAAVKRAFEGTYADIGITCKDVGGLWSDGENDYYKGMEPCIDVSDDDENGASHPVELITAFVATAALSILSL